jgi:hypothetical protein
VRYSLNVHAYSSLRMRASLTQSARAGRQMYLRAARRGQRADRRATPTERRPRPCPAASSTCSSSTRSTRSVRDRDRHVHPWRTAFWCGRGRTAASTATREQIVTGAVYPRGRPAAVHAGRRSDPQQARLDLCRLLRCLIGDRVVSPSSPRSCAAGVDLDAVRRCLEKSAAARRPERAAAERAGGGSRRRRAVILRTSRRSSGDQRCNEDQQSVIPRGPAARNRASSSASRRRSCTRA